MTKLDKPKLAAFADDNLNVIKMANFFLDKMENIVGKEENSSFPTMFSKGSFFRVVKSRDRVAKSQAHFCQSKAQM